MRSQETTWSTKQRRGTQVAHGSARASHNTGPLGVVSQYRITSCGKEETGHTSGLPCPTITYDSFSQ